MPHTGVTVLVVDDDDVCQIMVRRALREIGSPLRVVGAVDGMDALDVLRAPDADRVLKSPFVILLDLRMPRMNGLEFLEELRDDPTWRSAIVFILSTSDQEEDVKASYRLNVAGYLVKPMEYDVFVKMMTMLDQFCRFVAFPRGGSSSGERLHRIASASKGGLDPAILMNPLDPAPLPPRRI